MGWYRGGALGEHQSHGCSAKGIWNCGRRTSHFEHYLDSEVCNILAQNHKEFPKTPSPYYLLGCLVGIAQRAQSGLIIEYGLNDIGIPTMIQ